MPLWLYDLLQIYDNIGCFVGFLFLGEPLRAPLRFGFAVAHTFARSALGTRLRRALRIATAKKPRRTCWCDVVFFCIFLKIEFILFASLKNDT
jgi:hypothetical protein